MLRVPDLTAISCGQIEAERQQRRHLDTEAALPDSQKQMLRSLREKFPDIPIEYGDGSAYSS